MLAVDSLVIKIFPQSVKNEAISDVIYLFNIETVFTIFFSKI